jgi:4-carboxymuconolactone decarboxylase
MIADRLPPIPSEAWTPEQRSRAQEIIDGPRGELVSPFIPLLRSPELMAHSQRMGEYLRYRSAIGLRLSELAILVTARHWDQQAEWAIHAPIAVREGIAPEAVAAIALCEKPVALRDDESVVYDFCAELHGTKQVTDATWERAFAAFGEQGTVDLVGICGYYAFLAMMMNAAGTPAPVSRVAPLPPCPR